MTPPPRLVPARARGQWIGLMGGSFDPAHAGHRHCARRAKQRLGLDQVWWLISPQNPLKPKSAPLEARLASARAIAHGQAWLRVSAFEAGFGLRYTIETLRFLTKRANGARFVWIMGADSMATFHRWRAWRAIAETAPIVIIPRPGAGAQARGGKAFAILAHRRMPAGKLRNAALPAWALLEGPCNPLSSTALRARASRAKPSP
jgi:nicotinate-nucleotide adenylyltransferase